MIRLDDLRAGSSWRFDDVTAEGQASALGEVLDAVDAADRRARDDGEWVILAIAYEAAAAFDPSMRTAPSPPAGVPYVWWQSFAQRVPVAPITPQRSIRQRSIRRRPNRLPFPDAVEEVRRRIAVGDLYQANVCDRFDGDLDGTPIELYADLLAAQHGEFGAYIEMGERVIASVSPELFFSWSGDRITCRPMKGTARRHPRAERDVEVADQLQASVKDRAENVMIVDLLRNDLGRIARTGTVDVPELFRLERYETVWQLTSTITGTVDPEVPLVEVMAALFPCGSVTGAPKISAMSTIADLEADPRGIYCGAIGVLAPASEEPRATFSVPIRTAVVDPVCSTFEYGAGAGITWSSRPADEDREVEAKTRVLVARLPELSLLETMRLDGDGVRHADLHLERLAASAGWFGYPLDVERVLATLRALPLPPRDVVERVRVLLDVAGCVEVTHEPVDLTRPGPVVLAIDDAVTRSDDPLCCHKTTARDHYVAARRRHPGADDVILVNESGRVVETTIANLAVHLDGRWWCPPLDDGGLAGIARRVAIERGELGERSLTPDDVRRADGLAVLNSLRGWRDAVLAETGPGVGESQDT